MASTMASTESPPRARGRAPPIEALELDFGITPACAGKSAPSASASRRRRNHPRMRGEELRLWCRRGRRQGITPACAGKSSWRRRTRSSRRNHPRVRGEESASGVSRRLGLESPPRARGRASLATPAIPPHRITPACAGKRVMKMRPQRTWLYLLSANFPLFSRASFERRAIPKHGTEGYSIIKRHGISFVMRPGRPRPPVRAGSPRPTLHCP